MGKPCWHAAGTLFQRNFSFFLVFALFDTFVELCLGWSGATWMNILMACMLFASGVVVAYAAHLSELTDQRLSPMDLFTGKALPNRSFALVSLVVGFALLIAFSPIFLSAAFELTTDLGLQLGLGGVLLAYFIFLCRWGTIFPAAVYEDSWDVRAAHVRGRHTFWKLLVQLLGGAVFATYFVNWILARLTRHGYENFVWSEFSGFSASGTILAIVSSLAYTYVTLLGVSAFCNAYHFGNEHRNAI